MADGNVQRETSAKINPLLGLQFGWRRRIPMVLQTEASECGLACLVMLARYHGHDVDLPSMRRRFTTSAKGTNLARVMGMASDLDLSARPLRLNLQELDQLNLPCILHWNLNHFVVLQRVTSRHAYVLDPAHGERKLTFGEVSECFTGVALELTQTVDFRPIKEREAISIRALTGKVQGIVPAMIQILILALVIELFSLTGPFYMQWVLDQALVSADRGLLTLLGLGFLGVAIFKVLISAARSWAVTWMSATLNLQWINNLFGHLLRLPLSWFETRHIGDVVSRFSSMQTIQRTLTSQFISSLLDGLMSMVTLVVLCLYSVPLALVVIGAFVLFGMLRAIFYRPLYRAREDHIVYGARQQSELLESIRGVLPIKLGNKQAERQARYANATVETINRQVGIQRLHIIFTAFNQLVFGLGRVALIWIAAVMTLDGKFTVGMLVAFVAFADQFHGRAASLVDKIIEFRMLRLHAERLADIALHEPELRHPTNYGGELKDTSIEVRNVSFRYAEGEPWIVRHCSFHIDSGEAVAVVGPSGCGKTTLAKLILGLLVPDEGEILFGGIDIHRLGTDTYRSMISAVMQGDQLFAGSITDNISFFDAHASYDTCTAAAKQAAVHDEITTMPMGYETLVGDMGSSLSGGQKQRVILARALYRRPKLLVLDEATSHLDIARERQVNASICDLDLTRLIIAHRPETIAEADRILAFVNGQARFAEAPERSSAMP